MLNKKHLAQMLLLLKHLNYYTKKISQINLAYDICNITFSIRQAAFSGPLALRASLPAGLPFRICQIDGYFHHHISIPYYKKKSIDKNYIFFI